MGRERMLSAIALTLGAACAPRSSSPARRPETPGRAQGVTVEDTIVTRCSPRELPPDFGQRGVARMPPAVWARALAPVLSALCGCAPPRARVIITVKPNLGEVVASIADDASANACLGARLRSARFEPFDMGEGSDCIRCGPQALDPPNGAPLPAWIAPRVRPPPAGPTFTIAIDYVP